MSAPSVSISRNPLTLAALSLPSLAALLSAAPPVDCNRDVRSVVPGDLKTSDLWERIHSTAKDEQMPPPKSGKKLTPAQRATRDRWVEHGPGILMLCTTSGLDHGIGRSAGAAGGDGLLLALSREEEGEVPPVRRSFRLTEAIRNASSHQDRKMRPTAPRRRSTFTNLQTFTL